MKKVLLTESQIRLIKEEVDRNDSIQKLIFADPSEIEFEEDDSVIPTGVPVSRGYCRLIPVIGGKKIDERYVKFSAEEIRVKNTVIYQLHIYVDYSIRRLGIAEKLYTAFILQGYPACSLYTNRASSFYKDAGSEIKSDAAIENLWNKLAQNPHISVKPMKYNGKQIGVIGLRK